MSEFDGRTIEEFWDSLLGHRPVSDVQQPNQTVDETVRRFHSLSQAPTPGSARERARQRIFASESRSQESDMSSLVLQPSSVNGRSALSPPIPYSIVPSVPKPPLLTRRMLLSLAAAILIALAGFGGYLAQEHYFSNDPTPAPAVIPAVQETPTGDWYQYRNGPGHTAEASSPGPETNPTELWQFQTGGGINSEAAVVDGVVYFGSSDGNLYALDAATGGERWRFSADGAVDSAPAIDGDHLFFTSRNDELIALDRTKGTELWRFAKANGVGSPVLADGRIYVSGSDGGVYALDPATGEQIWRFETGTALGRSAAFAEGLVFAGTVDGALFAIDASSGEERWVFENESGEAFSTVVGAGTVYQVFNSGGAENSLVALDAATGTERWRFESPTNTPFSVPSTDGDSVYVTTDGGDLYAIDALSGEVGWNVKSGAPWQAGGTIAGDLLYIHNLAGSALFAFETATGVERWRLEGPAWAGKGPAVVEGVLYHGTSAGTFHAIGSGSDTASADSAASPAALSEPGPLTATGLWETSGAESSPFDVPTYMAIAPDGNLCVINARRSVVEVFAPDGAHVATWGEPGTGPGQFQFGTIGGIGIDADGSIFVFDTLNHRVQKFAPDWTFLLEWGTNGSGNGQFNEPHGYVDAANGKVYVADLNNRVQVFDLDGAFLDKWGSFGTAPGQFNKPTDISVDSEGNVYVAEETGTRVQKFDEHGTLIGTIEQPAGSPHRFSQVWGIAIDSEDRLYVSDWNGNRIQVYAQDGTLIGVIEDVPELGPFFHPSGITVANDGSVYVTDEGNNRIAKVQVDMPPLE